MKKESLKVNLFFQIVYEILVIFLPFILSPYVSRILGAERLGVYTFTYTVANYFVLVAMLGIRNYGNRAVAQSKNDPESLNRVFSSLFALHAVIALLLTAAYFLYVLCFADELTPFYLAQGLLVFSAVVDISWFYFGIEKFKATVGRNVIIKLLNLALIFLLVKTPDDLFTYCIIMASCTLFSQLLLWLPLRRYVRFVKPHRSEMFSHLRPMLLLFLPTIAISLYKYMDKLMIGSFSDKAQLGFYQNAEQLVNIPGVIITAVGTVMLAKMSSLTAEGERDKAQKYLSQSMQYFLMAAIAMAAGLAAVAEVFAPFYWGEEFAPCAPMITGLAVTVPFVTFANILRTQYLIPNARDKEYLLSVCAGAVVNVVLNRLLIPDMGAMGAVIGTVAAEVSVCVIQSVISRKELPVLRYALQTIPFLLSGALMFLVIYAICIFSPFPASGTLMLHIISGAAIYAVCAIAILIRRKDEFLTALLRKLRRGR